MSHIERGKYKIDLVGGPWDGGTWLIPKMDDYIYLPSPSSNAVILYQKRVVDEVTTYHFIEYETL